MDGPAPALLTHYVRLMVDYLGHFGIDVDRVLRQSDLSRSRLEDPSLVITYPVFHRLVVDTLSTSGEPALGLIVGERLVASSHGMLGFAALGSATIGQALELAERYVPLRTSLISLSHVAHADEVRVHVGEPHPLGTIQRPVLEAVTLSIKNILDSISMSACKVSMAAFPFEAPPYAPMARDLFRCEVRFGQSWAGLVLPGDALGVPLATADPEGLREASLICQRELDKLVAGASFASRVRRLMLERSERIPSLPAMARLLRTTARTLHRRLAVEGTSYREILEDVRRTLAVEYVASNRFRIEEIAVMLGYNDPANFRRAFRRWESVPPSGYSVLPSGKGAPSAPPAAGGKRAPRQSGNRR